MYNILLVEDEKDTARCVKEAFELEDIAVDVAYDGREGLNKFHEKEYDLILLDLQMPLMTGEELLHEVRKENPYIEIRLPVTGIKPCKNRFADVKATYRGLMLGTSQIMSRASQQVRSAVLNSYSL